MVTVREWVDRAQFVLLVVYHLLATALLAVGRWMGGKLTAVFPSTRPIIP